MGEVVRLPKRKKPTLSSASKEAMADAIRSVGGKPAGVAIVAISGDGRFAFRTVDDGSIKEFDLYSRAASVMDRARMNLLDDV